MTDHYAIPCIGMTKQWCQSSSIATGANKCQWQYNKGVCTDVSGGHLSRPAAAVKPAEESQSHGHSFETFGKIFPTLDILTNKVKQSLKMQAQPQNPSVGEPHTLNKYKDLSVPTSTDSLYRNYDMDLSGKKAYGKQYGDSKQCNCMPH